MTPIVKEQTAEHTKTIAAIILKLAQLGHEVSFTQPITTGPLITTFRFIPKAATKVAQICSCADDLALALGAEDVLVRRLPGEGVIGVSVPNASRTMVLWRDNMQPADASYTIPLNLGVDSQGRPYRDDLAKLPHLLIAGTTGAGKSTEVNAILASLIYWRTPDQIEFYLSDTKQVEFGLYAGAPHVKAIAQSMYTTWEMMDELTNDMETRLQTIGKAGCRNIAEYNGTRTKSVDGCHVHDPNQAMPYKILVIDELADVLGGDKRGEAKIAQQKLGRIVQKSRAAGVHVIAATQRPSVNIVAGSLKANFPARLTFRLPSDTDSRTVIGESGAEHLLQRGDMLYISGNTPGVKRLHAAYADIADIKQIVGMSKLQYAQP